jgi:pyruvate dehydrogenase E1 component beta subunit
MGIVTYREAVNCALADALATDDSVFFIGEDVAAAGGAFKVTEGLLERFGARRVKDAPISEQAIVGTAIGAAVGGLRPVAELMFADFTGVCHDQIVNEMAKYRYMTGGQVAVPVTIRMACGAGNGFGAQHSQSVENWFLNVPGLKLAVPRTPADAYWLLRGAIEDDDPVLVFEHKALYNTRGELDQSVAEHAWGRAAVVRQRALEAAAQLDERGISLEVIDPRTVIPLDLETMTVSLQKTGRLAIVQESPWNGSWGASLIAALATSSFDAFDSPPLLLAAGDSPIPYAANLEEAWMPSVARIASDIEHFLRGE